MAIAPQSNEAFLREVDEQVRLDTAQRFWQRWGKWVIALFVAALVALGAGLWWNSHQKSVAGVEGENLSLALDDLTENRPTKAEAGLKPLETSKTPGYRASSQMALAAMMLVKNDTKGAIAAYDRIAADTSLGQPFRDAATIRGAAAGFDTMKPEEIIAKLKPLAVAKGPWFGSAGEMTAVAYMKLNKTREAGAMFAAIAKDESVPESIRQRSVQLASVMGVDVGPLNIKNRN
ncbi:MAG: tetratricopeptide repeat protein [Sphingomonadales bacterium]